MDFDFETYKNSSELDFFGDFPLSNPQIRFREAPLYNASTFQTSWLGFRGPNSTSARGSLNTFSSGFKIEGKPEFEDFVNERSSMQQEILDLNRKNAMLEDEKERLITELVNMRVQEIEKNGTNVVQEIRPEFSHDPCEIAEDLQNQILESKRTIQKLETENNQFSERIFELEMDKQRLTIKLHQALQQCANLRDSNQDLKADVEDLYNEKKTLTEKIKKLEKLIEKIEEGDFEHVEETDDDLTNEVIELDSLEE